MPSEFHIVFIFFVLSAILLGACVLASAVLFQKPRTLANFFFAGVSLFSALWIAAGLFRFYYFLNIGPPPSIFSNLAFFFAFSIFVSFLLFSYSFLRRKLELPIFSQMILLTAYTTVTYHIFSGAIFISETYQEFSTQPLFEWDTAHYVLYVPLVLTLFVWGIVRLVRVYSETIDPLLKQRVLYILIGSAAAGTFGLVFGLLLPLFPPKADLFWVSQLSVAIFLTYATFALLRYRLFHIKVIATEFLVFVPWMFIFVRIFLAKDMVEAITNMILFCGVFGIGILLIKNVYKEVESREKIETLAEELSSANEHLRQLDARKIEFVSLASHQLRSPLTAIKGYSSMLLEGSYGHISKKVQEPISRIFQSSEYLVNIVEDFLNTTRIEQGRMKYDFAAVDMRGIVQDLVRDMERAVEEKDLSLFYEDDGAENYIVEADAEKIRQVVSNIIDNAVKYTKEGEIRVRLQKDKEKGVVIISVNDTGIGLTEEEISELFIKFSRAKDAQKVNTGGSGLGLYLAKQIVEAHNGRVWVESEGHGKGSAFFIELVEKGEK